jgi:23S rRNA pseudouridine2605 synthase
MSERLQKIIARAGVVSRRAAETLITQGRVSVNGRTVTELGSRADAARDEIVVDGEPLRRPKTAWILLHKPDGVMTTMSDPGGRPTVGMLIPPRLGRLFPVGRLDFQSSGLLLMTNDGETASRLLHPRSQIPRTYRVKVSGLPSEKTLEHLRKGVRLDDGVTGPAQVLVERTLPNKAWLRITIREGRHREIRRMCESLGHQVDRLIRVRFGPLELSGLDPGEFRHLTPGEIRQLTGDESQGGSGRTKRRNGLRGFCFSARIGSKQIQ